VRFIKWFFLAHTGQMAAYPVGSVRGGSALTAGLGLLGLWQLHRHGQRGLLVLVGGAFGLGFLAALLRRYPYGTSCRVAQHLAPFYCLLAGLGVAVLIQRLQTAPARWNVTLAFGGFLALIAAAAVVCDCVKPYRDRESRWARDLVDNLLARAGDDPILTAQDVRRTSPLFHYQLFRRAGRAVSPPNVDWRRMGREHSSLWVWSWDVASAEERNQFQALLAQSGRAWRRVEYTPSIFVPDHPALGFLHCQVSHWVCEP
jgi:hypothetical protein